jgi:hypothetical protein
VWFGGLRITNQMQGFISLLNDFSPLRSYYRENNGATIIAFKAVFTPCDLQYNNIAFNPTKTEGILRKFQKVL